MTHVLRRGTTILAAALLALTGALTTAANASTRPATGPYFYVGLRVITNNPLEHPQVTYQVGTKTWSGQVDSGWYRYWYGVPEGSLVTITASNDSMFYQHTHVAVRIRVNGTILSSAWAGGYDAQASGTYQSPLPGSPTVGTRPAGRSSLSPRPAGTVGQSAQVTYQVEANNPAEQPQVTYLGPSDGVVHIPDASNPWSWTGQLTLPSDGVFVQAANTSQTYPHARVTTRVIIDGTLLGAAVNGGLDTTSSTTVRPSPSD